VLHLWLPETLIELASRQAQSPVVRDPGEMRRYLELREQECLWFALTTRGHQVNGEFVDMTVIRRPYQEPHLFPELRAMLAKAAGNPPRDPTAELSTASVHIMTEESWKREPREVIGELLAHLSPPVVQGRKQ
jgi:hypothetical protein